MQWLTYLTNTLQAELMIYFYPQHHIKEESAQRDLVTMSEQRIYDMLVLLDKALSTTDFLVGEIVTLCDYYFSC